MKKAFVIIRVGILQAKFKQKEVNHANLHDA